jgi:radical SAM superfamily enzyme YgiQ (UPF0313 family)
MKVSFLIAYDKNSPYQWSLPPLGIGYLSSYAKQRCWFLETTFHHKAPEVIDQKPDLVAISASTENFQQACEDAQTIKEALGVPILLGGMHITSLPHTLPAEFDVGCIGEGEQTFVDLVNLYHVKKCPDATDLEKIPGIVYHDKGTRAYGPPRNAIKDLDSLPYPDRETIDKGWGLAASDEVHLISSRGCPYRCSFCSSAKHWKTFRFFSANYVADEIEFLREKYNPEIVYFFDDLFIGHVGRWREVVRIFRERKLHEGVRFRAYARVDLVTEQMAAEFDELNFKYIDFGFETNSAKMLKYLTKTRVTPEVNQRAVDWLRENHISIGANFIIGSPPETLEDMMETHRFVERNRDAFDRCSVGPLQALPGTGIWEEAVAKGKVSEDMDWSRLGVSYETFDFDRFPFLGENVTPEDFLRIYTDFHHLAKEINYVGQIRRLVDQKAQREQEVQALQDELARLKGSRLVGAAMKLRDWRQTRRAVDSETPSESTHAAA